MTIGLLTRRNGKAIFHKRSRRPPPENTFRSQNETIIQNITISRNCLMIATEIVIIRICMTLIGQ